MRPPRRIVIVLALAALCVLGAPDPAQAYIGPGAGFAVGTTVVAAFLAFLAGLTAFFLWPIRWALRAVRGRRAHAKARVKRFVVLGLDGMEPSLAEKYMAEGKMPNLARLREKGTYCKLGTTAPPLSPVAWSTFLTGCNPGKHNIFDFLMRDRRNYRPLLSSVDIRGPSRNLKIGKYNIPMGKANVRMLRKGTPFWKVLGDHGVFSSIIRVPITFPPEPFRGVMLSAMCVPDLRGTQGTFSFYTTRGEGEGEYIGGEQLRVKRVGDVIRSHLVGPENTIEPGTGPMQCPFAIEIKGKDRAELSICGTTIPLTKDEYTPWIPVTFNAGIGIKVKGICEFLLIATEPEFELYVTPIQIDPDAPAMPISHPSVYATYLSKRQNRFATLGLAEDTWGMNAKILDDDGFLHQCLEADEEREKMFFDSLDKVRRGLCVCVFDGTDRIQHMFWRYIDEKHPAHAGQCPQDRQRRDAIEQLYLRMDKLVGRTMAECNDDKTVLMVISDHGFNSFRRGVDWNVWLEQNGYLELKEGGRGKKYLGGVDWSQTKAYCLGLAGIWLNVKGREGQGIVDPKDAAALRDELCEKLTGLVDADTGEVAVTRALNAHKIYTGPYKADAPDIIMGYAKGYRVSWEAAIGDITDKVFHDNDKAWSGDHSIDPSHVPGVMFCNRKVEGDRPHLMDLGPTVLDLFGVKTPKYMDGRPLRVAEADGSFAKTNGAAQTTAVAAQK